MEFNKTPVRTAKNFGINDIVLDDFKVPKINYKNEELIDQEPLTYGVSKQLEDLNYKNSNKIIKNIYKNECDNNEEILFVLNKENCNLLENIEFICEENSKTDIIIKYISDDGFNCFHNGIIKINAKKNAKINIVIVNFLNEDSRNFLSIENKIEENAIVDYVIVDFGGKTSITNYYSNIIGENGKNNLNTIYLGKQSQLLDMNYIIDLNSRKAIANIDVQGALKDKSKKSFKGTLNFKKGSKKSKGNENEFCMLLSEKSRSKALPILLCMEEDVEGNHSTATGNVDPKLVFYIMSRGFSYNETMRLIVKAKFSNIIDKINNDNLKEIIKSEIDKRLD